MAAALSLTATPVPAQQSKAAPQCTPSAGLTRSRSCRKAAASPPVAHARTVLVAQRLRRAGALRARRQRRGDRRRAVDRVRRSTTGRRWPSDRVRPGRASTSADIGDNDAEAQAHHHLPRRRARRRPPVGERHRRLSCDLPGRRPRRRGAAGDAGRTPLHRDERRHRAGVPLSIPARAAARGPRCVSSASANHASHVRPAERSNHRWRRVAGRPVGRAAQQRRR